MLGLGLDALGLGQPPLQLGRARAIERVLDTQQPALLGEIQGDIGEIIYEIQTRY